MCRVGEKIYILGGQLELNVDEDSASIYILDTSTTPTFVPVH